MRFLAAVFLLLSACTLDTTDHYLMVTDSLEVQRVLGKFDTRAACEDAYRKSKLGQVILAHCTSEREYRATR